MARQIVLDSGPLSAAVLQLLEGVGITNKIEINYRESMTSGPPIMVLKDPEHYFWSTGENLLWDFVDSLAGRKEIDLKRLADYFRTTEHAPWMSEIFALLMGVPPQWEGARMVTSAHLSPSPLDPARLAREMGIEV